MCHYIRIPENKSDYVVGEEIINDTSNGVNKCWFYENPLDAYFGSIIYTYGLIEVLDDIYYYMHGCAEEPIYMVWTSRAKLIKHMTGQELINSIPDGKLTTLSGNIFNFKNGKYHSIDDEPAITRYTYGHTIYEQRWYDNGILHRNNDLPAISKTNLWKKWYKNGMVHRENDKPAIIYDSGRQEWWYNDKEHRENDKPAIMTYGCQQWFYDGEEYFPRNKEYIVANLKDWYYYESSIPIHSYQSKQKRTRYKK